MATRMGEVTVPEELFGCWSRAWIEFADGRRDTETRVWWLQLPSRVADVRLAPGLARLRGRGGFDGCTIAELHELAGADGSSGVTRCTPVESDQAGVRRATAEWLTRGVGVNFHPVSAFPEPGWLEWSADGTVLIERAPSGAYTEEWHLVPGSADRLEHRRGDDGSEVFVTGPVAARVRDRADEIPLARLTELVEAAGDDRERIAALLDCEFSVAIDEGDGDGYVITASTLPWLIGETIDVDLG